MVKAGLVNNLSQSTAVLSVQAYFGPNGMEGSLTGRKLPHPTSC